MCSVGFGREMQRPNTDDATNHVKRDAKENNDNNHRATSVTTRSQAYQKQANNESKGSNKTNKGMNVSRHDNAKESENNNVDNDYDNNIKKSDNDNDNTNGNNNFGATTKPKMLAIHSRVTIQPGSKD